MKKNNKKYQLWHYSDGGYVLDEFDTLNDILVYLPQIYTDNFYITQDINVELQEIYDPKK